MFKKICKSSVSALVLMGLLGVPDFSVAMEDTPGASNEQDLRSKVHRKFEDGSEDEVEIHSLPDEMLIAVFYECDPRTQATLRMICPRWVQIIGSTPYLDLLGKYNRAIDKYEWSELVPANKERSDSDDLKKHQEEMSALLHKGHPSVSLQRLLENGDQDYLIHNRGRLAPFLSAAVAQNPAALPIRLCHISDHYPWVFHACHRTLLRTLSETSSDFEQTGQIPLWGDNLLFLLDDKKINYLIENPVFFRKLAPFFVRVLKDNTGRLQEICEEFPDAFEILLPSLIELVTTPADFKNNFSFIAQDSRTFAYLLPSLKSLITNSPDLRKAFDELISEQDFYLDADIEKATVQVRELANGAPWNHLQLRNHLAVISLNEQLGSEEATIRLNHFYQILGSHIDSPETWIETDSYESEGQLIEYECLGPRSYYGFPVWCAYFPHHLPWWTAQTKAYVLKCEQKPNTAFLRRFLLAARSNLKRCSESLSKTPNASKWLEAYQKQLDLLQARLTLAYREKRDAWHMCLAYLEQPVHSVHELLDSVLDVYHHYGLFSQIVKECMSYLNNPRVSHSLKTILAVKMYDALLHSFDKLKDPQKFVQNLGEILKVFGEEDTLKAVVGVINEEASVVGRLSKRSVSFLKACFEVCIGSRPLEDLLDDLSIQMLHINDYFLRVNVIFEGQIPENYVLSNVQEISLSQMKVFYQQSIIARVLEVIAHVGYTTLREETKQTLLSLLKPAFSRLTAPEVGEILKSNPWDEMILKQTLLRYDILLLKVFKGDQEAAHDYQKLRLLLGIDLREEENQRPLTISLFNFPRSSMTAEH